MFNFSNTDSSSVNDGLSKPFWCFLATLFLLPIPLGANRPWAWSIFEIIFFLLCLYVTFKNREKPNIGITKYLSILAIFLVFLVLSIFQITPLPEFLLNLISPSSNELYGFTESNYRYISVDSGQSIISLIKSFSFFALMIVSLQLINSEYRIKLVLVTMFASGTFQAVYGSMEVLLDLNSSLIFNLNVTESATGSFVYKNHYANFLMLCLCAGIGLIVTTLEKEKGSSPKDIVRRIVTTILGSKAIIRICIAVMVIGLVMSKSRMGNAAFFSAMAITGILALLLIKNRSQGLVILVISMFIIDLLILSTYFGLERVQERLAQTSLQNETRDEVFADAIKIIADFPVFGSGAGSFYSIFPMYQSPEIRLFYDHAHNDYLQFTIEFGLIGAFVLSVLLLFTFYKGLRAMYRRKNSIFRGVGFACTMAFTGMAIHMFVDFPLQGFANASYFVVFMALAMVANSLKLKKKSSLQTI